MDLPRLPVPLNGSARAEAAPSTAESPAESTASLYCRLPAEPANLPIWRELFCAAEWVQLQLSPVYHGVGIAKANGDPIILVPGFLAPDTSLLEMRSWLERIGYDAYFSGFGRHDDCPDVLLTRLLETVQSVYEETKRPVRLIGHSLGGSLARAAAVQRADLVAQVITLGAPITGLRIHPLVIGLARILERSRPSPDEQPRPHGDHFHDGSCTCRLVEALARPFPARIPRLDLQQDRWSRGLADFA
jgi:pimeloyl-ACP methyl ester carboxylesterase